MLFKNTQLRVNYALKYCVCGLSVYEKGIHAVTAAWNPAVQQPVG